MKVGDKVRVINDLLDNAPEYVGQVGVLEDMEDDTHYDYVVRHEDGALMNWDERELEVVDE